MAGIQIKDGKIAIKNGAGVPILKERSPFIFDKFRQTITGYNGGIVVNVPTQIDGVDVLHLGLDCFLNDSIATITLPEGLLTIGANALSTNVFTELVIPNSVTSIDYNAFGHNDLLTSVTLSTSLTRLEDNLFYGCSALANINIPEGIISIGDNCFEQTALTSFTAPNTLLEIGYACFRNTPLASAMLNEGLTELGGQAFYNCELTSIIITETITDISSQQFLGNPIINISISNNVLLNNYTFAPNTSWQGSTDSGYKFAEFYNGNGKLADTYTFEDDYWTGTIFTFDKETQTLTDYDVVRGGTDVVVPVQIGGIDVLHIGGGGTVTLSNDYNEVSTDNDTFISLPSNYGDMPSVSETTPLPLGCFQDKGLTSVSLPTGLISIGICAFAFNSLTEIVIPNTVTFIGMLAFNNNSLLTSVSLSTNLTTLGIQAFSFCSLLTSINIPESVTVIGSSCFYQTALISFVAPSTLLTLGSTAFAYSQIASITLNPGLTSLGQLVFKDCYLTEVTVPASITDVTYTFQFNPITTITLGSGVTVNRYAFALKNESNSGDSGYEFMMFYNNNGKQAGTYHYSGSWSKIA